VKITKNCCGAKNNEQGGGTASYENFTETKQRENYELVCADMS